MEVPYRGKKTNEVKRSGISNSKDQVPTCYKQYDSNGIATHVSHKTLSTKVNMMFSNEKAKEATVCFEGCQDMIFEVKKNDYDTSFDKEEKSESFPKRAPKKMEEVEVKCQSTLKFSVPQFTDRAARSSKVKLLDWM